MLLQGSIMITPAPFRFIAVVTREATFAELDCLLRCIWFECCGHLSSFKVQLQSCCHTHHVVHHVSVFWLVALLAAKGFLHISAAY